MVDELRGRVAIVTGANHGIGAATAAALAGRGAAVVAGYLRLEDAQRAGTPGTYFENRARTADGMAAGIRAAGGSVLTVESDLADPAAPGNLFDAAEAEFGGVDILVNNASSWRQDSFLAGVPDSVGRVPEQVTAGSVEHNLAVDVAAGGGGRSDRVLVFRDRPAIDRQHHSPPLTATRKSAGSPPNQRFEGSESAGSPPNRLNVARS